MNQQRDKRINDISTRKEGNFFVNECTRKKMNAAKPNTAPNKLTDLILSIVVLNHTTLKTPKLISKTNKVI
jgi:hypothetical protein